MGRRVPPPACAHQRGNPADVQTARSSAPKASACAAPSTCSSTGDRIAAVREMILATDQMGRVAALAKILPMQRDDFAEIFRIMEDRPVHNPPAGSAAA
jgi:pyruvate,orthophosphate dikinase